MYINRVGLVIDSHTANLYTGVVQGHRDGYGFLVNEDESSADLFIPVEEMQKVLPGDHVIARGGYIDERGRLVAQIIKVTERKLKKIVGRYSVQRGIGVVTPEDIRIARKILVEPGKSLGAKPNQVVVVSLDQQGLLTSRAVGKVIEILGEVNDPGMEIEIAVRKFDLPYQFSDETKKEVKRFAKTVTTSDLRDRVDLRDIPFVTIDGADARDFDDAVYCEPLGARRGYRLLVAIADVSHYVKPASAIDLDAQLRTTSVYFPRRVIPMLPEELSNGLCSLNPNVDRCTIVCDAIISLKGDVKAYQFYPAVIRSAARLIYEDVWEALQNPNGPQALIMEAVLPNVQDLYKLYGILFKSRELRGAMDFETVETYIVANEEGKIENILPRERNDAHRLVEEMMLVANTCAADFIGKNKVPCLYRVHEPPKAEKLNKLRAALGPLGLTLGGLDNPEPKDYCKVIEQIKDRPDKEMIQTLLLRSMQQAVYSPHNGGHFGLAYPAYTHFTSPIRRYPDLLVHRTIRSILSGKNYVPKLLVEPSQDDVPFDVRKTMEAGSTEKKIANIGVWEKLGILCSSHERRADEASYDVTAWLKCYYMKQHMGATYQGIISGITQFGIFVTLKELYVEGSIHISMLGNDYYVFDENRNELCGLRSNFKFRLGDPLTVRVAACDLDARRIEFALIEDPSFSYQKDSDKKERESRRKGLNTRKPKAEKRRGKHG